MSTKINGFPASTEPLASIRGRSGNVQATDNAAARTGASGAGSGGAAADQVTLTDSALTLQKLGAAVASQPVVNTARVASVKQAVQSGTYQVNPASIAYKIIGFEKPLPSGK